MDTSRGAGFDVGDAVELWDGEGDSPPPEEPPRGPGDGSGGPGGSSGSSPGMPRRGYRQYLPFLALGAVFIAAERLLLIALATGGLSRDAYGLAACALLTVMLLGVGVGGRAFYRAWHADHARRGQYLGG